VIPQRFQLVRVGILTAFATIDDRSDTVGGGGRQQTGKAFRAAARHSRRVRLLRVALPVSIVLMLAIIFGLTFFNPLRILTKLPIDPGKVTISGTTVTMSAPRVAGFTRDQRAYDLSARAASQDVTKPNILFLQDLRAKVDLENGQVNMTATDGVFDRASEKLTLRDKIVLTSSTGYEARLTQAEIDTKSGSIVSQNPVDVKLLNGTLNANRLNIDDKGDIVRFGGGVTMTLMLDGAKPGETKAGDTKDSDALKASQQ
jgi:lipopolysaccharide export system protein LptC